MSEEIALLKQTEAIRKKAKINYYSLKFSHRNQSENYAVALPEDVNADVLDGICSDLENYSDFQAVSFNPMGTEEGTYELLSLTQVRDTWSKMFTLISEFLPHKTKDNRDKVPGSNLGICEMEFEGQRYFICSKQISLDKVLKGKLFFMKSEDKTAKVNSSDFFMIRSEVDFIIHPTDDETGGEIIVFNRKSFVSIFRYFEHLKQLVKANLTYVDEWKFLESTDLIKEKIDQKNVFANLSKVFADETYMDEIKAIKPATLKRRLLEKSNGAFSEADFSGTKLMVTKNNLDKVMKALAKGFKYNFFADRAEDV